MYAVLSLALGCGCVAASDEAACGPAPDSGDSATDRGDACAIGCPSVSSAVDCCVQLYGRGLSESDAELLASHCSDCSSEDFLSEDAAICVAGVRGLPAGVGDVWGIVKVYDGRVYWQVSSIADAACESAGDTHASGVYFDIDATTGGLVGDGQWTSTAVCE